MIQWAIVQLSPKPQWVNADRAQYVRSSSGPITIVVMTLLPREFDTMKVTVKWLICNYEIHSDDLCNEKTFDKKTFTTFPSVRPSETLVAKKQDAHQLVGHAKRRTTKNRPKAVAGGIFGCFCFLNFDKCRPRPDVAGDVISSAAVDCMSAWVSVQHLVSLS